ncbi:Alcohol dehydrogenase zinc-binding domain protein, partial [mine drainage metagenome]
VYLSRSRALMEHLTTLVANGTLKPVIDSVLPLDRAAEAHKRLETGGVRGKIVLEVAKT